MSLISKEIKLRLIANQLNQKLNPPNRYKTSDLTGIIGRAYAAQLLSVINYGFNVANRAELREEGDVLSFGESAINMNVVNSGRYLRSENNHPSREVYKSIQDFLKFDEIKLYNTPRNLSSIF